MVSGHKETAAFINSKQEKGYIWIHAASLGEFEQGRPVIEAIKKKSPDQKILLTFFSPSGYEVRKNYPFVDKVLYLPIDTNKNASAFINKIDIKLAIFIKYEFWFNYLSFLQQKNIPTYYISTVFREDHFYFKSKWMLQILKGVDHFYVQNKESLNIALINNLLNASLSGDTRLDSVLLNVKEDFACDEISEGLDGRQVVVFGSTWSGDHELILSFIKRHGDKYQYILAPHEIKEEIIKELINGISLNTTRLSFNERLKDVILIDSIGKLKYIYRYASLAYIGGGFNKSIHNTLEPLSYKIPVVFGPNGHQKFQEAVSIQKMKMGRLTTKESFDADLKFYLDSEKNRLQVSNSIEDYLAQNKGATQKIISGLHEKI